MSDPVERLAAALADRYVIERQLGTGGMATVYLARDTKHDRQVALKVLRPELAAVLGIERFLSEIRVTAHLQHRSDSGVVAVTVSRGPVFRTGPRRVLFDDEPYLESAPRPGHAYDVHPDGRRFLRIRRGEESRDVIVLLNWFANLRAGRP